MKVSLKCLMKHLCADMSMDVAVGDDFYPRWVFFFFFYETEGEDGKCAKSQMKLRNTQFVTLSRMMPLSVSWSDASVSGFKLKLYTEVRTTSVIIFVDKTATTLKSGWKHSSFLSNVLTYVLLWTITNFLLCCSDSWYSCSRALSF